VDLDLLLFPPSLPLLLLTLLFLLLRLSLDLDLERDLDRLLLLRFLSRSFVLGTRSESPLTASLLPPRSLETDLLVAPLALMLSSLFLLFPLLFFSFDALRLRLPLLFLSLDSLRLRLLLFFLLEEGDFDFRFSLFLPSASLLEEDCEEDRLWDLLRCFLSFSFDFDVDRDRLFLSFSFDFDVDLDRLFLSFDLLLSLFLLSRDLDLDLCLPFLSFDLERDRGDLLDRLLFFLCRSLSRERDLDLFLRDFEEGERDLLRLLLFCFLFGDFERDFLREAFISLVLSLLKVGVSLPPSTPPWECFLSDGPAKDGGGGAGLRNIDSEIF